MRPPTAAAIYTRISSDQDGTALGVSRQRDDCRELADRLGWIVAEEYTDNDISAYSGKRRPAYERMIADIIDGTRDGLIVYHVDRLTRRPIELEQFLETATAAKLRHIRFVTGDVDIANGDGLMVVRMMAAMAAHESASKSRRIRRKMDENAANGRPHGGSRRPFGFEDDRVTIRPDEADVIRDMVARFLAGESLRSLATWMDDNEIRSVYGKPWRTTTLRDLMTSPRIAGLRQHREEVVGPAVWQPIITQADRARVLALVAQRRTTHERTPRSYLLTGLLRCSNCNGTLFASRRQATRRYVCLSGPDHRGCGRRTVVAEPLEQLITAAVLYRLDTPQLADILAGRAAQDEQTATLSDALAREKAQREELAQMWADREINRTEWLTARAPIEARINGLERRLARMTDSTALAGYVGNGAALKAHWHDLNLTRQHAIVKAILDHAVIGPGTRGARHVEPARVDLHWRI